MVDRVRGTGTRIPPETVEEIVRFHGHMWPGLAMGIRAAEVALCEIGPRSSDEELVTLTETDMCAVDAIQYLTGCTFGKGTSSTWTTAITPTPSSGARTARLSAPRRA